MYNGFGRTVVKRGIVARVTMIAIDEDYLFLGFYWIPLDEKLITEERASTPPREEFSLDAKPLLAY